MANCNFRSIGTIFLGFLYHNYCSEASPRVTTSTDRKANSRTAEPVASCSDGLTFRDDGTADLCFARGYQDIHRGKGTMYPIKPAIEHDRVTISRDSAWQDNPFSLCALSSVVVQRSNAKQLTRDFKFNCTVDFDAESKIWSLHVYWPSICDVMCLYSEISSKAKLSAINI